MRVRGSWRPNRTAIYWPPLLWPSALCLSRSPGLLNRRPRGPALCWMMAFFTESYYQLLSKTPSGFPRAPSAGCGFPYHISSLTRLIFNSIGGPEGLLRRAVAFSTTACLRLLWTPTVWLPVLTELYNSSTPTQSPTQSLEWHVWSSFNRNNCHAVQRSFSSGASVYECIMDFYLVPFHQPNPPTRFLSITGHWNVSLPSGASLWKWHLWLGRMSICNLINREWYQHATSKGMDTYR